MTVLAIAFLVNCSRKIMRDHKIIRVGEQALSTALVVKATFHSKKTFNFMHDEFILIRKFSISSWWWGKLNQASSIPFYVKIEKIWKYMNLKAPKRQRIFQLFCSPDNLQLLFNIEKLKSNLKENYSHTRGHKMDANLAIQYRKYSTLCALHSVTF